MVDKKTTEQLKQLWADGQKELGNVMALMDEIQAEGGLEAVQKACQDALGITHSEFLGHCIVMGLMNDPDVTVIKIGDDTE
jgi:hypothetical protein